MLIRRFLREFFFSVYTYKQSLVANACVQRPPKSMRYAYAQGKLRQLLKFLLGFFFFFSSHKSSFLEYYLGFLPEQGPKMASLVLFKVT